jgi:protein gp37
LVSPGCTNCYAQKQAHRFSGKGQPYEDLTRMTEHGPVWTGKIRTVPEALDEPLHWRKPARIFVNSMSDLFHEGVPDSFIAEAWNTMATAIPDCRKRHCHDDQCLWNEPHTYQVLTKRPERMRDVVTRLPEIAARQLSLDAPLNTVLDVGDWPLPNVWLGVSVENQATADERIPILLQTPAAVRFLSVEPLLERIDLVPWLFVPDPTGAPADLIPRNRTTFEPALDWVIVGGESGPDARPCEIDWIRSLVTQCDYAQVPCFVKQFGSRPMGYLNGALVPWPNHHSKGTDLGAIPGHWPQEFPR